MNHTTTRKIFFLICSMMMAGAECAEAQEPPAADVVVTADHSKTILAAAPGQLVQLPGLDLAAFPQIPYETLILPGPQFLFADDPEYIRVPEAAAMRELVQPGTVRLYVYNVNGVKDPQMERKIVPVLKNLGDQPLHLRMLKYSSQPPSGNYYLVGKGGLRDFYAAKPSSEVRTVPAGGTIAIDEKFDKAIVKYDELVHGLYEFIVDQPAEISVIQTAPEANFAEANARITEVLPPKGNSGAGRGVYGVSNYEVLLGTENDFIYDTAGGPKQLIVADGKTDPWIRGRAAGQDALSVQKGNYGVMYNVHLKRTSGDGRGMALVMWNARHGGKWCDGMATSLKVNDEVIEVPSNTVAVYNPPDAVVVKVFPPLAPGETDTVDIIFSPPGASCLPAPLIFLPVDMNSKN